MSHKNIVAVVIVNSEGHVFVGKHADGPFKGKWGVASIDSSVDRRPMRAAARLLETCVVGMLGTRNNMFGLKKHTQSAMGLQLFEFKTDIATLPDLVENACSYMESCFAVGSSVPTGLIPWSSCKWLKREDKLSGMDPIAADAITHFRALC